MELPGKLRLDGAAWLTVQQHLYVAFGVVGAGIELLAILLTWVVAVQVRRHRPAFAWTVRRRPLRHRRPSPSGSPWWRQ